MAVVVVVLGQTIVLSSNLNLRMFMKQPNDVVKNETAKSGM